VLDAGPLIGLFYVADAHHITALTGFHQLHQERAAVLVPLPIVFEVYKWLTYRERRAVASLALTRMRATLEIVYPERVDLKAMVRVLRAMPEWPGSLEDALVAVTALQRDVPVWTFNYRDLAAFRNLHFWTPAPA
jgi:predicted nucleic acid-binding protein